MRIPTPGAGLGAREEPALVNPQYRNETTEGGDAVGASAAPSLGGAMHQPALPLDREVTEALRRLAGESVGAAFWVYAIRDPSTGDPFYVGQTKDPARQARQHIVAAGSAARQPSHGCRARLRAILGQGRVPVFKLVEGTATRLTAFAAEARWMRRFRAEGFNVEAPKVGHGQDGGGASGFGGTGVPLVRVWDLTLREAMEDRVGMRIACRACGTEVDVPLHRAIAQSSPGVALRAMRKALCCPGCGAGRVLRLTPPSA